MQSIALEGTDTLVIGVTTWVGDDDASAAKATTPSPSIAPVLALPVPTDPIASDRRALMEAEPWLRELSVDESLTRRYRFGRLLGRGTAGIVLEATERATGRPMAIKLLYPVAGCSPEGQAERFRREGRVLSAVRHPHVVEILEVGRTGNRPYIVTERAGGGTLRSWLEAAGRLPLQEALRVTFELLEGLAACHERGIIHRDIKPENILLDQRGSARLADFGLAKTYDDGPVVTRAGMVLGTPLYMAPELARGEPAALASDVYACGVLLYEMLAGKPPLTGGALARHLTGRIAVLPEPLAQAAPGTPWAICDVVAKAMARSISDRPSSAADLAARLRHALAPTRRRPCPGPGLGSWWSPSSLRVRIARAAASLALLLRNPTRRPAETPS